VTTTEPGRAASLTVSLPVSDAALAARAAAESESAGLGRRCPASELS
jgi:hypothetical protein